MRKIIEFSGRRSMGDLPFSLRLGVDTEIILPLLGENPAQLIFSYSVADNTETIFVVWASNMRMVELDPAMMQAPSGEKHTQ